MTERKTGVGGAEFKIQPVYELRSKIAMSQSTIKLKALSQMSRAIRAGSNRTSLAINAGKDLILLLRLIPETVGKSVGNASSSALTALQSFKIPRVSSSVAEAVSEIKPESLVKSTPASLADKPLDEKKDHQIITPMMRSTEKPSPLEPLTSSSSGEPNPQPKPNPPKDFLEDMPPLQLSSEEKDKINKSSLNLETVKMFESNLQWQNLEARTKYLLSSIAKNIGNSPFSMIHQIDDLYNHMYQYPDTRVVAVENGGIKILSRLVQMHQNDAYILNKSRETLAILGHNPPVKGKGIKILTIDGGGTRGLVAIEVLRQIESLTGKKIYELFDYICGVSTGALIALLLGAQRRSLDEVESLYRHLSIEIFGSQNSFMGNASLLWNSSYYHTPTWEKILKKNVGDSTLITLARDPTLPRVSAISTVVNQDRVVPHVFRTYTFPPGRRSRYIGGFKYALWEACRASAAAPTYFEEIKLGNYLHQDGGVIANNPTSIAISEARTIWQNVPLQCVVSLGTGITLAPQLDKNINELINHGEEDGKVDKSQTISSLSWKGKFLKMLDSATDTEAVHNTLNELLPADIYFRFNPYLSEVMQLDEWKQDKLEQVKKESREYLTRNNEKVKFLSKVLLREKSYFNQVIDWWAYNF